jgi:hypothetical protein
MDAMRYRLNCPILMSPPGYCCRQSLPGYRCRQLVPVAVVAAQLLLIYFDGGCKG